MLQEQVVNLLNRTTNKCNDFTLYPICIHNQHKGTKLTYPCGEAVTSQVDQNRYGFTSNE
jgi:hypothetical protein